MIQFEVQCESRAGQAVHVLGSGPLGDWDLGRSLALRPSGQSMWVGQVNTLLSSGVEFKYALVDAGVAEWEALGPARRADPKAQNAKVIILRHVFGDGAKGSVEVIEPCAFVEGGGKAADASTKTPNSSEEDFSGSGSDSGSSGKKTPERERLLDRLHVDPSVRFGRFHREHGTFAQKYAMRDEDILGTGMSGGVCLAFSRTSGVQVAVKTLSMAGLGPEKLAQVTAEVENQLMMDHPNICRLLEVFEEPGCLRLVMERMRGPDLFDHLSTKGRYTERDAAGVVRQMLAAVAYCHRHGVCHRDLKLDNFCLAVDSQEATARVKLIDFGLSSVAEDDMPMTHACGTLYYVAPEVLRRSYDKKCDLWSLGVLTYILLDGRPPFSGRDDRATYTLIRQGRYGFPANRWSHISDEAKDFVSSLLRLDVSQRLDSEAALAHPWLAEAAGSVEAELPPLDAAVLGSMRSFLNSSALKRAVLQAIAPVATVERMAAWADHFEALDVDGDGRVAMGDLAQRLMEQSGISAGEAGDLSAALAEADCGGELVSYSAFLSAVLAAHVRLDDRELRSLFERLDSNKSGTVSVQDVCGALGDIVDMDQVGADFVGKELTYNDFRWLMSMPGYGPSSIIALRQLLGACSSVQSSWKVSTRRAKAVADDGEAMEAARRENMAWRVMFKRSWSGKAQEEEVPPRVAQAALSLKSMALARGLATREQLSGMSPAQVRGLVVDDLAAKERGDPEDLAEMADEELADMLGRAGHAAPPSCEGASAFGLSARTPTSALIRLDGESPGVWQCATVAAKEGDVEAARQENMTWRKMHIHQKKRAASPAGR